MCVGLNLAVCYYRCPTYIEVLRIQVSEGKFSNWQQILHRDYL
jgi:hypothetical protein